MVPTNSIRNRLTGTITEIVTDTVVSEVVIDTAAGTVSAVITTRSVQELNLKVGLPVYAIIKATSVSVERANPSPDRPLADAGGGTADDGDMVVGHVGGVGG